ncbi:HNH endonuclease [Kitasatospora sp. NPDC057904]|uniref:HNH endonuclease n=1 Tax=Kitasatospora sp. NPDC057904 TaxID=3346275 RepID=UPI0036DEEF0A
MVLRDRRTWLVRGHNIRKTDCFPRWVEEGICATSWHSVGYLAPHPVMTRDEHGDVFNTAYGGGGRVGTRATECWYFLNAIQPGDLVIVSGSLKPGHLPVKVGVVTSHPLWRPNDPTACRARRTDWLAHDDNAIDRDEFRTDIGGFLKAHRASVWPVDEVHDRNKYGEITSDLLRLLGTRGINLSPQTVEAPPLSTYALRCAEWDLRDRPERIAATGSKFKRDQELRALVAARSDRCENPDCLTPAEYYAALDSKGMPILEVDHVQDLGLEGADRPDNMIVLCPNCHALKSRSTRSGSMREKLREIALRLHEQAAGG